MAGSFMWRLLDCFKPPPDSGVGGVGLVGGRPGEPRAALQYRAPIVAPPQRAGSLSSLSDSEPHDDVRGDQGGALLPKHAAPEAPLGGGGASSSSNLAALASPARLRRAGSGASLPRPRSRGALTPGAKLCKGVSGSMQSLSDLGGGGVGTEVLLGDGDQTDDEDCCPTCLEAYSMDNPRVWTRCNHAFHMQCIYSWLERSEACPFCEAPIVLEDLLLGGRDDG